MPRVLFLQATDPAAYPPLINAGMLMAEAGWDVTYLSAPMADLPLAMPTHERITVHHMPTRPSYVMHKSDYLAYAARALRLALRLRPQVVYASDVLGAGPGLAAARAAGAMLVYHEHDPPDPGRGVLNIVRRSAARSARLIIFPNLRRAEIAQAELGFAQKKVRVIWNMPRLAELPTLATRPDSPLSLYYHGSITHERMPDAMTQVLARFDGQVRLRIAGYEAPGAPGFVTRLSSSSPWIEYLGIIEKREALLAAAASSHAGLALTPLDAADGTMANLAGASNKPFDYMASGMALVVSDRPEWREMFVDPGYGLACDPGSADSLASAIGWFLHHGDDRRAMGARGRTKIEAEWNYDTAFAPVIAVLQAEHR